MMAFRKSIKGLLSSRSKFRVGLAILSCVLVFGSAMELLTSLARKELKADAMEKAGFEAEKLSMVASVTSMANGWVLCSFLNGFSSCETVEEKDTSWVRHYFTDTQLRDLNREKISGNLHSFLRYNTEFHSLVMVFRENVLKDAPGGIAIEAKRTESGATDILPGSDIFSSKLFNNAREAKGVYTRAGATSDTGEWVWTYAVPLFDSKGGFIGELWGNISAHLEYDEISAFNNVPLTMIGLFDRNGKVIAINEPGKSGMMLKDVLTEKYGDSVPDGWLSKAMEGLASANSCRFSSDMGGMTIDTHICNVKSTPFKLLVLKAEKEIYRKVDNIRLLMTIIAVLCLILVNFCLFYVFSAFNRAYGDKLLLENELDIAAKIQKDILPPNPDVQGPDFSIYGFQRPAKSVGGDLFDHMVRDGRLFFCLGDVSGKGVPAALLMAEICSLFRMISRRESDPVAIMRELNGAVVEHEDCSMFCTMFIGILDLRSGHLEFCNAGHNPPILIHSGGQADYLKIKPNMPLYAFEGYPYAGESADIAPSDTLFVYSDGVTEAKSTADTFFGENAVLNCIRRNGGKSLREICDGILSELELFTRGAEQNDDITMLTIRYTHVDNQDK